MIEVVKLPVGRKLHAINQDNPRFTLCGSWISDNAEPVDGVDAFPTCKRCSLAVMKS